MLICAFSYDAFYTVTNLLYFSLLHFMFISSASLLSVFFLFLSTLCLLCHFLLSPFSFLSSLCNCPVVFFFPSVYLPPPLSLSVCLSSGSPSSQSLYVWLSQWNLLHAALPAFGSGQDTAADAGEQCQARVSANITGIHSLSFSLSVSSLSFIHTCQTYIIK